jgi:hypothetical protein
MTNNKPDDVGTSPDAKALWHSVADDYELDEHEAALLRQAVRTIDLIDTLQAKIDEIGAIVESPQGVKANPAVVEIRQQRIVLARLLAALRLPTGDEADAKRPQRRGGVSRPRAI